MSGRIQYVGDCYICATGHNFPSAYGIGPNSRICAFHEDLYATCMARLEQLWNPEDPWRHKPGVMEKILDEVQGRHPEHAK